jgi:hypothetical protein
MVSKIRHFKIKGRHAKWLSLLALAAVVSLSACVVAQRRLTRPRLRGIRR